LLGGALTLAAATIAPNGARAAAFPTLCLHTGTAYAVRVFSGATSWGDIGIFWPDCR
jgi:hypothetical protein